jgi:hypothetical protein
VRHATDQLYEVVVYGIGTLIHPTPIDGLYCKLYARARSELEACHAATRYLVRLGVKLSHESKVEARLLDRVSLLAAQVAARRVITGE